MRISRRRENQAFGQWLRRRREASGKTHVGFALSLGISPGYLGQLEQGAVPPEARIRQMAESVGEDPDLWVAASQSDDPAGMGEQGDITDLRPARPSEVLVPVIGEVKADALDDGEEHRDELFYATREHAAQADGGVARISGKSMMPYLLPGDYVGISRHRTPKKGDVVLAERGRVTYLKRLATRRGRRLRLESDNDAFGAVEGDDIRLLAVVVWIHRQVE